MLEAQMLDDPIGRYALLVMIAAAAVWKIWLRLKQDTRADKSEARDYRARGDIVGEYDKVVETLREEVERNARNVERLSRELHDERTARFAAERLVSELQERIEYLERRLREEDDK